MSERDFRKEIIERYTTPYGDTYEWDPDTPHDMGWMIEDMLDEIDRLRNLLSSHDPVGHNVTNKQYIEALDEIDRLRAEVARLKKE